jgi:hypothetical protein
MAQFAMSDWENGNREQRCWKVERAIEKISVNFALSDEGKGNKEVIVGRLREQLK